MLHIVISNAKERQDFEHVAGPIEFGRGPEREGVPRCVIQDVYISRDHVRAEELGDGRVLINNLSLHNLVRSVTDNSVIDKGEKSMLQSPVRLSAGETVIDIQTLIDPLAGAPLESVKASPRQGQRIGSAVGAGEALRPAAADAGQLPPQASLLDLGESPSPERLLEWFETLVAVQRSAAGSAEFYQQTAEAVTRLIGLDRGLVILRAPRSPSAPNHNRWVVQARFPDDGRESGREFSLTVLDRVLKDRRTYYQSSLPSTSTSLQDVMAVAASPIFDPQGDVGGFVYGCRTRFTARHGPGIGPLEAQVMQVLAASVAAGQARQQREAESGRTRVQFEQFFSAELAQELQRNPALLEGQEREITVLSSDIRGFSRLSERLGPHHTCELVADVMDRLTNCVRAHGGSVVDYSGDGLMAMWNAPAEQPDHAARACRAALAMLATLPQLDADWHGRLGAPLKVGVGLNTGLATVGNMGSRLRFKYGPRGPTVNLASRTEAATKLVGVPLLITGTTRAQLGPEFAVRRLGKVRLAGIDGVVEFHELLAGSASLEALARRDSYEQVLGLYEAAQFGPACRAIHPLLTNQEGNFDMPCLNLLTRIVQAIKDPLKKFEGLFELASR